MTRNTINSFLMILALTTAVQAGESTIALSKAAAVEMVKIAEEQGMKNWAVKIGFKKVEGNDKFYELDLTEDAATNEVDVSKSNELDIHVLKSQLPQLKGTTIDFKNDGNEKGFVFKNLNDK